MSSEKRKPGPAYQPLVNQQSGNVSSVPSVVVVPQPQAMAVVQPQQPMMVMYATNGPGLALGPSQAAMAPVVTFSPMAMPTAAVPHVVRPQSVTPNTHLVLTFVMFVILTVLAPETLVFMVPALVLAIMSNNAVTRGQYARAKKLGHGALALNFIGLIAAFVVAIVCVALSISLYPWNRGANDYYYGYYGGCYYDYSYDPYLDDEGSGLVVDPPMICY